MRCVACYPACVQVAGTPQWCVVSGPTVGMAWDTGARFLVWSPARMTLTEMAAVLAKLESVSDLPQAQMTRLIQSMYVGKCSDGRMVI